MITAILCLFLVNARRTLRLGDVVDYAAGERYALKPEVAEAFIAEGACEPVGVLGDDDDDALGEMRQLRAQHLRHVEVQRLAVAEEIAAAGAEAARLAAERASNE